MKPLTSQQNSIATIEQLIYQTNKAYENRNNDLPYVGMRPSLFEALLNVLSDAIDNVPNNNEFALSSNQLQQLVDCLIPDKSVTIDDYIDFNDIGNIKR